MPTSVVPDGKFEHVADDIVKLADTGSTAGAAASAVPAPHASAPTARIDSANRSSFSPFPLGKVFAGARHNARRVARVGAQEIVGLGAT